MDIAETSLPLTSVIQRFGALIACDLKFGEITHVSENIATVLGKTPDFWLGVPLASIAPRDLIHDLRNIMSLRHFAVDRHFAGSHQMPMGVRDVSVSQSSANSHVVIEFEPPAVSHQTSHDFAAELRYLSTELRASCSDENLLEMMAKLLRHATGYDCAAVYRYGPGGGEVIAQSGHLLQQELVGKRLNYLEDLPEAKPEFSHPSLHFIADASENAARILALDDALGGLDLSHCHLRGASKAEVDALSELGASAVVSLPIVLNSGIWGSALLLSQTPRAPSRHVRQICDALASIIGDRLEILDHSLASRRALDVSELCVASVFAGKSALVFEHNRLIAADLKLTLLEMGFATVAIFDEEAPAFEYLASNHVDLGVLDVHSNGASTSFEVARKLAELGTPFLFAAGYGASADLPVWLGSRSMVLKPAGRQDLSARVNELLNAGPADPARGNDAAKGPER